MRGEDNSQEAKLKITVYQVATSYFVIEDTNYHNVILTENSLDQTAHRTTI